MQRNPWVAGLLSALATGLGQVYDGRLGRGVILYLALAMTALATLLVMVHAPGGMAALVVPIALVLGLWIYNIVDAARLARAAGADFQPRRYNRWWVYVGVLLVAGLILEPLVRSWLVAHVAESFRVQSGAMAPTIAAGDYVVAAKGVRAPFRRGDVVALEVPGVPRLLVIKRIVGVPGDRVAMARGILSVNGTPVPEPYVQHADPGEDVSTPDMAWQKAALAPGVGAATYQPTRDNWGPLIVPAGQYFTLGDNRDDSMDSRNFGFVAADRIRGAPTRVYFSRDPETGVVRWGRIGRSVR